MSGISPLKDNDGNWDIAYVSLAGVAVATIGPILAMTTLTWVAYFRCTPMIVKDVLNVCTFDPQPLGNAIGFACGGFGVALGALAAYMAATRRPAGSSTTTTHVEGPAPALPAVPAVPINVAVVDQSKPIEVQEVRANDAKTKPSKPRGKTH